MSPIVSLNTLISLDIRILAKSRLLIDGKKFKISWSRNSLVVKRMELFAQNNGLFVRGLDEGDHPFGRGSERGFLGITYTDCFFGGSRPWFRCPIKDCSRKAAILYYADRLVCRHCVRGFYPSQRANKYERLVDRLNHLKARIGLAPTDDLALARKPKGMHTSSFFELKSEASRLEERCLEVWCRSYDALSNNG